MTAEDLDVGVVVVTHKAPRLAIDCIGSVSSVVAPADIVCVVNAPSLCDPQDLMELRDRCRVVANPEPLGYGANLNRGVRLLQSDKRHGSVLLLNDDLTLSGATVRRLAEVLRQGGRLAVVAPAVLGEDGSPQASVFDFPSLRTELAMRLVGPERVRRFIRREDGSSPRASVQRADWVLGAALMVRADAFDHVGGFDERFFLYTEETDFCRRLRSAGWDVAATADVAVVHRGGTSTSSAEQARHLQLTRRTYRRLHWSRRRSAALWVLSALATVYNSAYWVIRTATRLPRPTEGRAWWPGRRRGGS